MKENKVNEDLLCGLRDNRQCRYEMHFTLRLSMQHDSVGIKKKKKNRHNN